MPQERAKYAMLGGSEVVVGISTASRSVMHAHHGAMTIRRRAPAPSAPSHHSMTLHATSKVILSLDKSVSNT